MSSMNEEVLVIRLRQFMSGPDGWGHEQGRDVHAKLLKELEANPGRTVIRVSLKEVQRTDASFPRESVVELARRFRGHKGFCLVDLGDEDLLENWDAAALRREQPLICWRDETYRILGPNPSSGNAAILELVMKKGSLTASAAARALDLKLTNASMKLKQLLDQGFVLRKEETAPSGGVEYTYIRIK